MNPSSLEERQTLTPFRPGRDVTAAAAPSAVRGRRALALMAGLVPFFLLVALHWSYAPLASRADYAQYLLHAKALVDGRPYTDIGYIYSARAPWVGPVAYPPGLPLTLAPVLAVAGPNPALLRLLMVASAVAFLLIAGWRIASRYGLWLGAGVVLLCGVALETEYATNAVMSDLGFCALAWGLVVLVERTTRWTLARVALVTVLGGAAMAYRAVGVVIIPSLALYVLLRHRGQWVRGLIAPAVWTAALAVVAMRQQGPLLPVSYNRGAAWWEHLLASKIRGYRLPIFETLLYPFPWDIANDAYHVLAVLVMLLGLWGWVRSERLSFLFVFAGVYALLLLVVPWIDGRYLWPVLPILAFGTVNGVRLIAARLRPAWPSARAARVAAVTVALVAGTAAATHAAGPRPLTLTDQPDVRALFDWLGRLRTHEPIRVAFVNPRVLTWEEGIPAMGVFAAAPDTVIEECRAKGLTHVVVGHPQGVADLDRGFREAVAARPQAFSLEYRNATFAVYRLTSEP